jgi:hypothetical protein
VVRVRSRERAAVGCYTLPQCRRGVRRRFTTSDRASSEYSPRLGPLRARPSLCPCSTAYMHAHCIGSRRCELTAGVSSHLLRVPLHCGTASARSDGLAVPHARARGRGGLYCIALSRATHSRGYSFVRAPQVQVVEGRRVRRGAAAPPCALPDVPGGHRSVCAHPRHAFRNAPISFHFGEAAGGGEARAA